MVDTAQFCTRCATASPSEIARAVQDVLADAGFAERARQMAGMLAAEGSSADRLTVETEAFAAEDRAEKLERAA
jgi:UDP:flavonoid glycosyltransferase YjiC (YdhE family)